MGFYSDFSQVFRGFGTGFLMHQSKKIADTILQGQNAVLACPHQLEQVGRAFLQISDVANKIMNLYSCGRLASFSTSALTSVPVFIAVELTVFVSAMYQNDQYERLISIPNFFVDELQLPEKYRLNPEVSQLTKKVFVWINANAGDASQVIVAVCAVAKYTLGAEKEAITTLIFMGIGYADRKGLLSERLSILFNDNLATIANISIIILGSPLEKLISVINLALSVGAIMEQASFIIDSVIAPYFASEDICYPSLRFFGQKPVATPIKFTADQILNFDPSIPTRVDPASAQRHISIVNSNPNTKFETLNELFEKVGYEGDSLIRLVKKIEQDDRFIKEFLPKSEEIQTLLADCLTPIGKQLWMNALAGKLNYDNLKPIYEEISLAGKAKWEKGLYEHTKKQLSLFVENISGKKQPKGDLSGIINSRNNCKILIAHLEQLYQKIENEDTPAQEKQGLKVLIQNRLNTLAIEGGDYCVTGIERAIRECYNFMLEEGGGFTDIRSHIDYMAQTARTDLFNEGYGRLTELKEYKPFFETLGANDVHVYNQFKQLYGKGLGIDRSTALNDKTVEINALQELVVLVIYPFVRLVFWNIDLEQKRIDERVTEAENLFNVNMIEVKNIINGPGSDWKAIRIAKNVIQIVPPAFRTIKSVFQLSLFGILRLTKQFASFPYSEEILIERAKALIGTNISRDDYITWWNNYIDQLCLGNNVVKMGLEAKILENHDYDTDDMHGGDYNPNHHFGEEGGLFVPKNGQSVANEKYLKIMLIEMGILKKPVVLAQTP
jgi:hypothetical protein